MLIAEEAATARSGARAPYLATVRMHAGKCRGLALAKLQVASDKPGLRLETLPLQARIPA